MRKVIIDMKKDTKRFFGVSFPFDDYAWDNSEIIRKIAVKHGIRKTGSGAGFGMRDLDFEIDDTSNLAAFKDEVDKLKIKALTYTE